MEFERKREFESEIGIESEFLAPELGGANSPLAVHCKNVKFFLDLVAYTRNLQVLHQISRCRQGDILEVVMPDLDPLEMVYWHISTSFHDHDVNCRVQFTATECSAAHRRARMTVSSSRERPLRSSCRTDWPRGARLENRSPLTFNGLFEDKRYWKRDTGYGSCCKAKITDF